MKIILLWFHRRCRFLFCHFLGSFLTYEMYCIFIIYVGTEFCCLTLPSSTIYTCQKMHIVGLPTTSFFCFLYHYHHHHHYHYHRCRFPSLVCFTVQAIVAIVKEKLVWTEKRLNTNLTLTTSFSLENKSDDDIYKTFLLQIIVLS